MRIAAIVVVMGMAIATARADTQAPATDEPAPVTAGEPAPVTAGEPAPVMAGEPAPVTAGEPADSPNSSRPSDRPRPQLQLDLGLSVIGVGFELPLGGHIAAQVEAFIMGTYFLPWFDLGDNGRGFGGGLRVTYFPREGGRGVYFTPYVRVARLSGEHQAGIDATGVAEEVGGFVGYAFKLTRRLDLRVGGGVQYIHIDGGADGDGRLRAGTPFIALDAVVGYRL